MANKKISELTELTAPADADLYPIVDDSESSGEQTKKVTHANLQTAILNHATALTLSIADTGQVQVTDGAVLPVTDDDVVVEPDEVTVFFDEASIPDGEQWDVVLPVALAHTRAVVVFVSRRYAGSRPRGS